VGEDVKHVFRGFFPVSRIISDDIAGGRISSSCSVLGNLLLDKPTVNSFPYQVAGKISSHVQSADFFPGEDKPAPRVMNKRGAGRMVSKFSPSPNRLKEKPLLMAQNPPNPENCPGYAFSGLHHTLNPCFAFYTAAFCFGMSTILSSYSSKLGSFTCALFAMARCTALEL